MTAVTHKFCAGCEDGMPWQGLPCPHCACAACERGRVYTGPEPLRAVEFAGELVWHAMLGMDPPWGEVFADGANGSDIVENRRLTPITAVDGGAR